MKKIISGLLGIIAIVGLTAGIAYAAFTDSVTLTGMVLGTQTPNLEIKPDLDGASWGSSVDLSNYPNIFDKLVPGGHDHGYFYLKNTSSESPTDDNWQPLNFTLSGKLLGGLTGDWNELKDVLYARVYPDGTEEGQKPNYLSLNDWYTTGFNIAGDVLGPGVERKFAVEFKLDESATNSASGKTLSNITFEISGTQAE